MPRAKAAPPIGLRDAVVLLDRGLLRAYGGCSREIVALFRPSRRELRDLEADRSSSAAATQRELFTTAADPTRGSTPLPPFRLPPWFPPLGKGKI